MELTNERINHFTSDVVFRILRPCPRAGGRRVHEVSGPPLHRGLTGGRPASGGRGGGEGGPEGGLRAGGLCPLLSYTHNSVRTQAEKKGRFRNGANCKGTGSATFCHPWSVSLGRRIEIHRIWFSVVNKPLYLSTWSTCSLIWNHYSYKQGFLYFIYSILNLLTNLLLKRQGFLCIKVVQMSTISRDYNTPRIFKGSYLTNRGFYVWIQPFTQYTWSPLYTALYTIYMEPPVYNPLHNIHRAPCIQPFTQYT